MIFPPADPSPLSMNDTQETQDEQGGEALAAAIPFIHQAADEGNPQAQYRLGLLYANGEGLPLDYVAAADYFEQAAEQGVAEAMRLLAWLHANGFGVEQSDERTRHWYLRAAEGGDLNAQLTVATMYLLGRYGAEREPKKMLYWFQQAAEQGSAAAQYQLGKLLAEGKVVEQNDEAAFQWLTLAIMHGSEQAKQELAMLSARLSAEQLETFKARMTQAFQGQSDG